jgi:hypothetical protein
MIMEETSRQRWFWLGCALTGVASLLLMTFPIISTLPFLSDGAVFSFVCVLTVLMGCGATLAVFNIRRP